MPHHDLKVIRPERMNRVPIKTTADSVRLLCRMFWCVLVMHLGFTALIVFHDYVGGDWVAHVKPSFGGELPESLWSFPYWFYIYIPAALFLYGLWELIPLGSVFWNRKQIIETGSVIHSASMTKGTMLIAGLGLSLMLMMWLSVLVMTGDHFGIQIILIMSWGAALKIGWLIGKS